MRRQSWAKRRRFASATAREQQRARAPGGCSAREEPRRDNVLVGTALPPRTSWIAAVSATDSSRVATTSPTRSPSPVDVYCIIPPSSRGGGLWQSGREWGVRLVGFVDADCQV